MRGGYRIKWMDDTRALIIFEHPATGKIDDFTLNLFIQKLTMKLKLTSLFFLARKAYLDNVTNQLAQIKPYDGPTDFLQKSWCFILLYY
jgi:hypothetical protein